jgi:hypothetical protein
VAFVDYCFMGFCVRLEFFTDEGLGWITLI